MHSGWEFSHRLGFNVENFMETVLLLLEILKDLLLSKWGMKNKKEGGEVVWLMVFF